MDIGGWLWFLHSLVPSKFGRESLPLPHVFVLDDDVVVDPGREPADVQHLPADLLVDGAVQVVEDELWKKKTNLA